MHGKAREASELHHRFIEAVKEQKEDQEVEDHETKHDDATAKLLKQEPMQKTKTSIPRKLVLTTDVFPIFRRP